MRYEKYFETKQAGGSLTLLTRKEREQHADEDLIRYTHSSFGTSTGHSQLHTDLFNTEGF